MTHAYYWFCIFVGLNASLILFLALNVSRLRIIRKIPYGDGGDKDMNQAIRAHANGVEQVGIFALLVLALNLLFVSDAYLAMLVLSFTFARVLHAWGMLRRSFNVKRLGAMLTYAAYLAAIVKLFAVVGD